MKNLLKRIASVLLIGSGYVGVIVFLAHSSNTDIWNLVGQGLYNAKDMAHVDSNYNFRLYNGNIIFGDNGLTPSKNNTQTTASTSVGGFYGIKVPFLNVSTFTTTAGQLICASSTTGSGWVCPNVTATTTVVGVVDGAYANNVVGYMYVGGYAIITTTGPIAIGDLLVSTSPTNGSGTQGPAGVGSSVWGEAATNNSAANGTVIGKALSTNSSNASPSSTLAIISLQ